MIRSDYLVFHEITNGPFNDSYAVTCTLLQISQGINLAASALE